MMDVPLRYAIFVLGAGVIFAVGAGGQTQTQAVQRPPVKAANAWMKVPMDAGAPDDLIPYIRHLRDEFWDNRLGHFGVLTPKTAVHSSSGDGGYQPQDIPDLVPSQALFIGTFKRYRTACTPSGRAIYTDMAFTVDHLFRDAIRGHAVTNTEVTVSVAGGTVRTGGGQIISFLTDPDADFAEPGKTYLLMTHYETGGDFYIGGTPDWDLSDGTVRVNSPQAKGRIARGDSKINGISKQELIVLLDGRFSGKR
jgi:hypothetical protein